MPRKVLIGSSTTSTEASECPLLCMANTQTHCRSDLTGRKPRGQPHAPLPTNKVTKEKRNLLKIGKEKSVGIREECRSSIAVSRRGFGRYWENFLSILLYQRLSTRSIYPLDGDLHT